MPVEKDYNTIAVVTPCHNSEKYLAEAIDSVINQKGDFYIDYVVIDGGSSDLTLEILLYYSQLVEIDGIRRCRGVSFRYLSEPDSGMYDALVKGFKMVKGDIACYINSDDFYLPNAFQTIATQFEKPQVRWLTGLPCIYNEAGAIRPSMSPCLYRSSLIRKGAYGRYLPHIQQESTFWSYGLLDTVDLAQLSTMKMAGDFFLWSKFAETEQLYTLDVLVSGFRLHSGNMSQKNDQYCIELEQIVEGKIGVLDKLYLFGLKVAFKLFGNNIVGFSKSVIKVDI